MTKIEWTDKTWNPVTGCDKVSPGCDNCYAESIAHRFAGGPGFPNGFAVTLRPERLAKPLTWHKPSMVFVNSMSDLFHDDVPDSYIAQVWMTMSHAKQHTFQILTKRGGRMRSWVQRWTNGEIPHPETGIRPPGRSVLPNVWLGVSAENQKWADVRVPQLLGVPAAVRFISAEPLLGPIDLASKGFLARDEFERGIDWVIVGGESGPKARPMHPDWARSLRDQCTRAGVALHFKQWGTWAPLDTPDDEGADLYVQREDGRTAISDDLRHIQSGHSWGMRRTGKMVAGRALDGRTWDEFPEVS